MFTALGERVSSNMRWPSQMSLSRITPLVVTVLLLGACSSGAADDGTTAEPDTTAPSTSGPSSTTTTEGQEPTPPPAPPTTTTTVPPRPDVPDGPLDQELQDGIDELFSTLAVGIQTGTVREMGLAGDARLGWLLADLLRFLGPGEPRDITIQAFEDATGADLENTGAAWVQATNVMINWDIPDFPRYVEWKADLFSAVDSRWQPFFDDPDSTIDYRLLSWGGVRPDDRPLDQPDVRCRGGCIPAIDFPGVTDAAGGDWYDDDRVVFGLEINGEARAYPRNIMEVHEMVIDNVGGTLIGMPYCTLCGTAAAFDLESVPDEVAPPVLRTSGLLVRSNKLMYDLNTWSAFDMFTGRAVSGPLREIGVELESITVVTATWGAWKEAHPDTTIVAQDGGIGFVYEDDPLGGRDDRGPIFPVGPIDDRLPVQEQVLGVETPDGRFFAFPAAAAGEALAAGESVELDGVIVTADADGLRAELSDGTALATTQSFWFAWSQFHPTTEVWQPGL